MWEGGIVYLFHLNDIGYQRGRRDYHRGGRGGGRGGQKGDRERGYARQNSDHRSGGSDNNNKTAFKYDSEFDFESANARFKKEDLELEFKEKLRIEDGARKVSEGSGRGMEGESSDEEEVIVEEEEVAEDEDVEEFYDKSKSFFDNISCEGNSTGINRWVGLGGVPRWFAFFHFLLLLHLYWSLMFSLYISSFFYHPFLHVLSPSLCVFSTFHMYIPLDLHIQYIYIFYYYYYFFFPLSLLFIHPSLSLL